ncbi:hypothetical protein GCM10023196_086500 [Actinoallomurus vinaceus]|uniref:Uncharacterized protein n=1 Tax=Actinoallomurus vinaceus TaxID=1080074 RepID=A0ABP8UPU2_9ACTN
MKITGISRRRISMVALVAALATGGLTIWADSYGNGSPLLVNESSKIAHLSSVQRAFVSGVILDAQANSRAISIAREEVKPAPALASFGRTISTVKSRYPAAFQKVDPSASMRRIQGVYHGRQAVVEGNRLQTVLRNAEAMQGVSASQYPVIDMDAGVSGVQINHTAQQGSTATISGKTLQWAVMGQVQPSGNIAWAEPENALLITAHLTRIKGVWKIDSLSRTFAPGSEP